MKLVVALLVSLLLLSAVAVAIVPPQPVQGTAVTLWTEGFGGNMIPVCALVIGPSNENPTRAINAVYVWTPAHQYYDPVYVSVAAAYVDFWDGQHSHAYWTVPSAVCFAPPS